jgi:hypothetical protein
MLLVLVLLYTSRRRAMLAIEILVGLQDHLSSRVVPSDLEQEGEP